MPKRLPLVPPAAAPEAPLAPANPVWMDLVTRKVAALQYGVVQIVIHDSKVVQVESTERHRIEVRSQS